MTQASTHLTDQSPPRDPVALFAQRAARFTEVLDRAAGSPGAWEAPTPCEGWSVRDVVEHVISSQRDFLARQELDAGPEPDLADPVAAWRTQHAHVTDVLTADVAGREYDSYFGRTTLGDTLADFYGWDMVVHGSDVARATGQEWSVSEEEAAALHATADGWGDALSSEGVCAPAIEVGEDASPTERLLARLGRDPHWRPA
jgi:uncharacterized protein (TIGR03086 family)